MRFRFGRYTMSRPGRATTTLHPHSLPLYLALSSLLVKLNPLSQDREPLYPYSATFSAAILHIVAREVFEVSYHSARLISSPTDLSPSSSWSSKPTLSSGENARR
jgi:hypothetical protein